MFFSFPSDLKKTTVVVESLSNNTTNALFQRIPAYFKVKQLVLRKEIQEAVQRSEPKVPKIPPWNGNNNKAIPKVSANKPPDPKASVQKGNTLRRSTRERKPNSRYTQSWTYLTMLNIWTISKLKDMSDS